MAQIVSKILLIYSKMTSITQALRTSVVSKMVSLVAPNKIMTKELILSYLLMIYTTMMKLISIMLVIIMKVMVHQALNRLTSYQMALILVHPLIVIHLLTLFHHTKILMMISITLDQVHSIFIVLKKSNAIYKY